jgi:hypothetical protein
MSPSSNVSGSVAGRLVAQGAVWVEPEQTLGIDGQVKCKGPTINPSTIV